MKTKLYCAYCRTLLGEAEFQCAKPEDVVVFCDGSHSLYSGNPNSDEEVTKWDYAQQDSKKPDPWIGKFNITDRALLALNTGSEQAHNRHQKLIQPAHILYGLLREKYGVAARVLHFLRLEEVSITNYLNLNEIKDISSDSALPETSALAGVLEAQDNPPLLPFSPETKNLLKRSMEESIRQDLNYIGTEHLLLGVIALEDESVTKILKSNNLTPEIVRQEVLELMMGL